MALAFGRSLLQNYGKSLCRHYSTLSKRDFGIFEAVAAPGIVSDGLSIQKGIRTPEYWPDGRPNLSPAKIDLKKPHQIEGMRNACSLARQVMNIIGENVKIGVTTDDLDKIAHEAIQSRKAFPSPLLYRGYPKSICTSVNNVACHGIPDDRPLTNGDIVSVDVTVYFEGYHGDCCETWCLPDVDWYGERLVNIARLARDKAISVCGPGVPMAEIGEVCDITARENGFTVVPVFIGHGIGSYFHGLPDVYHFSNSGDEVMREGMTFTIEPVIAQGIDQVVILEDGWTAMTLDGGRAAQFEHTVLITKDGHEILTKYTKS